jgi:hypothetical protein
MTDKIPVRQERGSCRDNPGDRNHDSDWYANIRSLEATRRQAEARSAAQPPVEMVRCDCGHTVRRGAVMSASLGTSCPECYDAMSA